MNSAGVWGRKYGVVWDALNVSGVDDKGQRDAFLVRRPAGGVAGLWMA